jgi:membrane-bound ClpP family serine protease
MSRYAPSAFLILLNPDYIYGPAMFMWIIILALLFIGLALIVAELVFIPGTTLIGLLGLICIIAGIVVSYRHFGSDVGFYVLVGTGAVTLGTLFYSFRSRSWSKFSLKTAIDSRVNEGLTDTLQVGDTGIAMSTLRPFGKALFNQREYEVKTSGNYLEAGSEVKIIQISSNQIIVEPLTKSS